MLLNNITKTILDTNDISTINPNFDVIKKLSKQESSDLQLIPFDYDDKWQITHIITTNNKPSEIKSYIDAHYPKNKIYYTDDEWFQKCINWYDTMIMKEDQLKNVYNYEQSVKWLEAERLMMQHFENKANLEESYFVNEIVRLAFMAWASDLHRQAERDGVIIRIRKDWVLKNLFTISYLDYSKYIMKIKYISWVKINIDHTPQDGRFDFQVKNWDTIKKVDVRVSIMPWLRWQSVVMRYLDATKSIMNLEDLYLGDNNMDIILNNIDKNYGMILVTWPTGSGKTTTLYSMINKLNNTKRKIVTLEDPVEYEIPWIQQSQINTSKWYDFKDGLESILRHDPDIILVWEIRDLETAEIAINASLTWHLVLSTLHTNTAVEAVSRMLNLWVKPHLLAPALNMIIWQRLVRRLDDTKILKDTTQEDTATLSEYISYNQNYIPSFTIESPKQLYYSSSEDGYAGRFSVMECLNVTEQIKKAILEWKLSLDILNIAKNQWFVDIKMDCINKIFAWATSFDEYRRIL